MHHPMYPCTDRVVITLHSLYCRWWFISTVHSAFHPLPTFMSRKFSHLLHNINHVLSCCHSALSQIRSITTSLPSHSLNTLVIAPVHSRLDYCNVAFAGLPLWHPVTTVGLQHSRMSGRWLIATWSRNFSAAQPSLAACQAANWVPAVYVGQPQHHPTWWTWSWGATVRAGVRSAASTTVAVSQTVIVWRPVIRCSWSLCCVEQTPTTVPPLPYVHSAVTFKRQLKTFLYNEI